VILTLATQHAMRPAPYSHPRLGVFYSVSPNYLINGTNFEENILKMCVLISSITSV